MVHDDAKDIDFLLTQTDLISYIHKHPRCISCGDIPLYSLFPGKHLLGDQPSNVLTMKHTDSLCDGVYKMIKHRIPSIAILEDGNPVGALSSGDVLRLEQQSVSMLHAPVMEYLELLRQSIEDYDAQFCLVSGYSTFSQVIQILAERAMDRVWITHRSRLVGVVSCSDILANLIGKIPMSPYAVD